MGATRRHGWVSPRSPHSIHGRAKLRSNGSGSPVGIYEKSSVSTTGCNAACPIGLYPRENRPTATLDSRQPRNGQVAHPGVHHQAEAAILLVHHADADRESPWNNCSPWGSLSIPASARCCTKGVCLAQRLSTGSTYQRWMPSSRYGPVLSTIALEIRTTKP